MPPRLIKAYIEEAGSLHTVIVLRGVSHDESLKQFVLEKLLPLLEKRETPLDIRIDPLLFERFSIKAVPTFVATFKRKPSLSRGKQKPEMWFKLSGAVTARWALSQLKKRARESDEKMP